MTNNTTSRLSASQEDYLETILELIDEKNAARVRDIADKLNVAKSSVTVALRMLRKRNLVNYEPYELVSLTAEGEELAKRITKRHETLSEFFKDILNLDKHSAEKNACRIEHAIGDKAMQRLECFVDFMKNSTVPANQLSQAFKKHCKSNKEKENCP